MPRTIAAVPHRRGCERRLDLGLDDEVGHAPRLAGERIAGLGLLGEKAHRLLAVADRAFDQLDPAGAAGAGLAVVGEVEIGGKRRREDRLLRRRP